MIFSKGYVPKGGDFIDAYNQAVRRDWVGTIKCNIDSSNLYYVVVEKRV